MTHRLAWEEAFGPIPDGMSVCHKCDNPPCLNTEHLFLGTHADNMRDMAQKGRHRSKTNPEGYSSVTGDNHWTRRKPEMVKHGSKHILAKLTESQVKDIRARYSEGGVTQQALATEYGVSHQRVSKITRKQIWKHVK